MSVDAELARTRLAEQVRGLDRMVSDYAGGDGAGRVVVDGKIVYVRLPGRQGGAGFVLKIDCGERYPLYPPSYSFVDPVTLKDAGPEAWPDDDHGAFKTLDDPPWVCLPGTIEYGRRHASPWFNPYRDSICQTVFHIIQRIDGRGGDGA